MVFNRFTREARGSVEAAVEEARLLGHDSVGDEDLLLGILQADRGVAGEALRSAGMTLEHTREASEELLADALSSVGISLEDVRREAGEAFEMRLPDDRRIPFSPRAKKALDQSLGEALRLGDNRLTPEHVLLGILRNEGGTTARILTSRGIQISEIEDRLDRLQGRHRAS